MTFAELVRLVDPSSIPEEFDPTGADREEPDQRAYNQAAFQRLERKAYQAARAVEWSSSSLGPRGIINQELATRDRWTVLGVRCPIHSDLHWIAHGYNDSWKRFEIISNSQSGRDAHPPNRRWIERRVSRDAFVSNFPMTFNLWTAPIYERGWVLESFDRPRQPPCHLQLQMGLSAQDASVTFTFLGPAIRVGLVGDYENAPVSAKSRPEESSPDAIRHYTVMASISPAIKPRDAFYTNVIATGEAARLGRDVVLGKGLTLEFPTTVKRRRLTDGQVLVLGVYNPAYDENAWIAVRSENGRLESSGPLGNGFDPSSPWTPLLDRVDFQIPREIGGVARHQDHLGPRSGKFRRDRVDVPHEPVAREAPKGMVVGPIRCTPSTSTIPGQVLEGPGVRELLEIGESTEVF